MTTLRARHQRVEPVWCVKIIVFFEVIGPFIRDIVPCPASFMVGPQVGYIANIIMDGVIVWFAHHAPDSDTVDFITYLDESVAAQLGDSIQFAIPSLWEDSIPGRIAYAWSSADQGLGGLQKLEPLSVRDKRIRETSRRVIVYAQLCVSGHRG